jgi:hypothetical protein
MLGVLLVLIALSSVAAAAFQLGKVSEDYKEGVDGSKEQYNTSIVVLALGIMLAMSGVFTAVTGFNPFNSMSNNTQSLSFV